MKEHSNIPRKPSWLKIKLPTGEGYARMSKIVKQHGLNTICSSGMCPNIGECWGNGTATFMILGDVCTRSCRFCATTTGKPLPPDPLEPEHLARSVRLMGIKHCVVTSVTRDDLPDGGAKHWHDTIVEIRRQNPDTKIEVLIPDFNGDTSLVDVVLEAKPDIVAHNLETVRRLTPIVRSKASYEKSLKIIAHIAKKGYLAKSGIMLGLGEKESEVEQLMDDLIAIGCKSITIGQYLQPRTENLAVAEYVDPVQFEHYRKMAVAKGFGFVESGPLVRSSYHAEEVAKRAGNTMQ
ncbi:MAG TPA: lipoyl synthase [Tenuifilaceae bacterium]|nr:lipoyl synthase [Tenuifilaceae bacterium]